MATDITVVPNHFLIDRNRLTLIKPNISFKMRFSGSALRNVRNKMCCLDPDFLNLWNLFAPWIRDGKNSDPESGIKIPDPQYYNANKDKKYLS
jgi:hypothetical protein